MSSIEIARQKFPELRGFFDGMQQMKGALSVASELIGSLSPEKRREFILGARAIMQSLRECADEIEVTLAKTDAGPS